MHVVAAPDKFRGSVSAEEVARGRGIILADTKFEFGRPVGPPTRPGAPSAPILLADEVLTPDSSRFWPADSWQPGRAGGQPSYDKQFVRDWLETTGWDKASTPPALPDDVVAKTAAKYREAVDRLTKS